MARDATRAIREKHPNAHILALTSYKEEELVQNALKAGAIGYLLKSIPADELANAIRAAKQGKPTLAPEATEALIHAATHAYEPAPGDELTPREKEVLNLMKDGLNNNEIAEKLFVSVSTVKFHVSSILSKLGVGNRTEAVAMAIKQNLV